MADLNLEACGNDRAPNCTQGSGHSQQSVWKWARGSVACAPREGIVGQRFTADSIWVLPVDSWAPLSCQGVSFVPMLVWLLLFPLLPFPGDHKPAHLLLCSSSDRSTIQSSWQETNPLLPGLAPLLFPVCLMCKVPRVLLQLVGSVVASDWSAPETGTQLLPSLVLGAGLGNRES